MKIEKVEDADLIVIGGGASGLMAAITAAEQGKKVLLLEQQEKAGRKLSATGNGKCNFTNADMNSGAFFQGEGENFAAYALSVFPPEKAVAFFEESGIYAAEKNGYYYPLSGQAELVKEALVFRCLYGNRKAGNVKCKYSCRVTGLKKINAIFFVQLEDGYTYKSKRVILACGSMAAPQLGGSELGMILAQQMGHTVIPMLPALCGLTTSYPGWDRAGHVRVMAEVSVYYGKEKKGLIGKEYGELQITDYGISGIPVFQLSGKTVRLLKKKRTVTAVLDFFPQEIRSDASILLDFLNQQKRQYPLKTVISVLSGILPDKVAKLVLMEALGKQKKNRQEAIQIQLLDEKQLEKLIQVIRAFEIPITGQTGFEHAQAASGGISTKEICPETMESKRVPGLYFSGELIDVVGICGGYNLHWAWASGYLAGMAASCD